LITIEFIVNNKIRKIEKATERIKKVKKEAEVALRKV